MWIRSLVSSWMDWSKLIYTAVSTSLLWLIMVTKHSEWCGSENTSVTCSKKSVSIEMFTCALFYHACSFTTILGLSHKFYNDLSKFYFWESPTWLQRPEHLKQYWEVRRHRLHLPLSTLILLYLCGISSLESYHYIGNKNKHTFQQLHIDNAVTLPPSRTGS